VNVHRLAALVGSVLLGIVINEMSDLSPWIADRLVRVAAALRYGRTVRAAVRAEELQALVNERPGNLLKVATALAFVITASVTRARTAIARSRPRSSGSTLSQSGPSRSMSAFLLPDDKFRGEWRTHWTVLGFEFFAAAAATFVTGYLWEYHSTRHEGEHALVDVVIWVVAVAACAYRTGGWYFDRLMFTDKRIVMISGLFLRTTRLVPFARITGVTLKQSRPGRLFGYRTLVLEWDLTGWNLPRRRLPIDAPVLAHKIIETMAPSAEHGAGTHRGPAGAGPVR
jgi:membrane protein YdbS with pleckstrin-like domain